MASSSPVAVSREGELWTICMDAGENRFNPRMISALNAALDQVESSSGAACVLFTSASPKFFSNGLDLDHIARSELSGFVSREFEPFLARVLGFSVPTLAVPSLCCDAICLALRTLARGLSWLTGAHKTTARSSSTI